ncbi:hypothetical protein PIB30_060138 [Stylosanthes scabra]|uniref:Replication factor A C-terminal domain-containing protein n=1 Tax=Stylosanthes scabra TaxID=79078 RepID=A0ABU6QJW6_9FABA|nr:hypothetical protein [Stylosanthes scabra]
MEMKIRVPYLNVGIDSKSVERALHSRKRCVNRSSGSKVIATEICSGYCAIFSNSLLIPTQKNPLNPNIPAKNPNSEDFISGKSWWYKVCSNCLNAVKEDGDIYKCPNCQGKAETFTPKHTLNLKVADEDSYASFIMYETVGSDYLNISASDLRTKRIMRGGNKNEFPDELGKFRDKTFLFKVSVKLENLNSFQPISIIVIKLYHDESIINSFIKKYNLEQMDNHESSKNITPSKTGDNTNSPNKNGSSDGVYDENSDVACDKHKLTMNQDHLYADEPTTTSDSISEIAESEN